MYLIFATRKLNYLTATKLYLKYISINKTKENPRFLGGLSSRFVSYRPYHWGDMLE